MAVFLHPSIRINLERIYGRYATLTDSAGSHVYTNDTMVEFTVRGNAELVGSNPVRAEAGIATILLRTGNPGKIMIKASAPGVSEAELMTESEQ